MMNNETILKKIDALNKTYWFASDISDYLGCSMTRAVKIKNSVLINSGTIKEHQKEKNQSVKADDVIKYLGGNNRLEEIQILESLVTICKNIER